MTSENTNETKPIEGFVARVLTARELAINVGKKDGVQPGMRFRVMAEEVIEIPDPITGEMLGAIEREKVRVQATTVFDKFAICRTYETRTVGVGLAGILASNMFAEPREIPETLKIEDSTLPPPLAEEHSYVKKGDRVIQLLKDD